MNADQLRDIIEKAYPSLNKEERGVALANLRRYFEVALALAEELQCAAARLTPPAPVHTIKERSNGNLKT